MSTYVILFDWHLITDGCTYVWCILDPPPPPKKYLPPTTVGRRIVSADSDAGPKNDVGFQRGNNTRSALIFR